jgi:hypothetical protein
MGGIMFQEEYHIQVAVVQWLKINHPEVLFTIAPSGMKLPIQVAARLKKMGYSAGTPDIMIFESRNKYHGLFIELKTKTGRVTTQQGEWSTALISRGYMALVCRSFEDAVATINTYLKETDFSIDNSD